MLLAFWGIPTNRIWLLDTSHLDALALGAWFSLAVRGPRGPSALIRPARYVAAVSAVLLAAVIVWLGRMVHMDPLFQAFGMPPLVAFFGSGLILVAYAPRSSVLGRLLGARPLRFFGTYSYGLYVWHALLMPFFDEWFPTTSYQLALGSWSAAALLHGGLSTAVSVAVALVSYHLYEKPFLAGKARFTDQQVIPRPGLLRGSGARSAANSYARLKSREDERVRSPDLDP